MPQDKRNQPIGVFDSGLGGLTALGPLIQRMPNESTIYLGDLANTPYGGRTNVEITEFALRGYRFLRERGIKALVVACNSASAVALPGLNAAADVPIFDVVRPGSLIANRHSHSRSIGVVGTPATVRSKAYVLELKSLDINLAVHQAACARLAPLIEQDINNIEVYLSVVRDCLNHLPLSDIDTLILGCTHYPLITDVFRAACGDEMRLIDSGEAAAEIVAEELAELGLLNPGTTQPTHEYYVTKPRDRQGAARFKSKAERFLGRVITNLRTCDITESQVSETLRVDATNPHTTPGL